MKLRFKNPIRAYLVGPSEASLKLGTTFEHLGFLVSFTFEGNKIEDMRTWEILKDSFDKESPYSQQLKFLVYEVDDQSVARVEDLSLAECIAGETNLERLAGFLIGIINKTLTAIRNFGLIPHLAEIRLTPEGTKRLLRQSDVEYLDDSAGIWTRICVEKPDTLLSVLMDIGMNEPATPQIGVSSWPDIEEALQESINAGPEQEFLVNAIEYIRLRNYRTALIEACICLDIVVGRFLKQHLSMVKGFSGNRIERVLRSEVGLVLNTIELKTVSIDGVLTAIKWRNTLIHESGHLPEVPEAQLRNRILDVFSLSERLAKIQRQMLVQPGLESIAQETARRFNVPQPAITIGRRHVYLAKFTFFITDEFPFPERMNEIATDLGVQLAASDVRFDPREGLLVRFTDFPNKTIAVYVFGELQVIAEASPRLSPTPPPPSITDGA
jgi:hypothetical protein